MTPSPPDPSLPARLREFHERLPLAGDPPNALLSLPDDRILYLAAILRDTPVSAPALSAEEWQAFLDHLRPHGVYPLMAYRLRAWPAECRPPPDIMAWLNRVFLFAAARAMRAGRQIQEVVDALEGAGIPSVLLKGPALARTMYPDPALRQSSDIDLLVRPRDFLQAEAVLEGLGYVSPKNEFHVSQHQYHHQVFEPQGTGMPLELHWALDTEYDLFPDNWIEQVFSRRIPIRAADLAGPTLSPVDHLHFLVFHNVFVDMTASLDRMCDTALVIAAVEGIDQWNDLIHRSVDYHVRISLELAVTAAGLWVGAALPEEVSNSAYWPAPREREERLWRHAVAQHGSLCSALYLQMQGQPGFVEKVRFGCRTVIPPTPMLAEYRRSASRMDIPLAHLRRWASIKRYF